MGKTTSYLKTQLKTVVKTNIGVAVTATGWVIAGDGSWLLDQNLSAKIMLFPIPDLGVGDVITGFRIIGSVGAKASGSTTLDADLRRNLKGAGAITDASVGAIAQQVLEADTALDVEKTISNHLVADDYFYYVKVTGTTADNAENDANIIGIEVDVIKSFGLE